MTDPGNLQTWPLLLGAVGATYLWRGLGVVFASRIDPDGPAFQWITCVSYAMLSGLIARMVFLPEGPLTEAPLSYRVAGIITGLAVFFILRRQVLAGVAAGLAMFIGLIYLV